MSAVLFDLTRIGPELWTSGRVRFLYPQESLSATKLVDVLVVERKGRQRWSIGMRLWASIHNTVGKRVLVERGQKLSNGNVKI